MLFPSQRGQGGTTVNGVRLGPSSLLPDRPGVSPCAVGAFGDSPGSRGSERSILVLLGSNGLLISVEAREPQEPGRVFSFSKSH